MADSIIGRLVYLITGDTAGLGRKLTEAERMLRSAGRKMESIGKSLSLSVTVPVLAIGTAFVKTAIDAEETAAKFGTAFRDVRGEADETANALREGYGLSRVEAQRLLSTTGDLLKGFGATGGEALGLSDRVQKLAVDLASYNNIQGGASRASEILTKAMLGERESLTQLGIKISEADVRTRLLANGQANLEGRALLLAKAQTTLDLALEQSGDALGDFARTADSPANQLKTLKARAEDLATTVGQDLLPIATELIGWARDAVDRFSALDEEQRKTILRVAGLAAAIGPVLIISGKLTQSVAALSTAFKLGTSVMGVYGIAAVALVAAVAGLVAWNNRIREARERQDELLESTKRLVTVTNDLQREQARAQIKIMTTALTDQNQILERNKRGLTAAKAELLRLEDEMSKAAPAAARGLAGGLMAARIEIATFEKRVSDTQSRVLELNAGLRENQKAVEAYTEANRIANTVTEETKPLVEEKIDYEQRVIDAMEEEAALNRVLADLVISRANDAVEAARREEEAMRQTEMSYQRMSQTVASYAMPVISAIGAAIRDSSDGWETFKDAAKNAIAGVLEGLARMWITMAATHLIPSPATFNPPAAYGLFAQAAAATLAAGFVRALASGGEFVTNGPQLIAVGDNPGGRERVSVTPESSPVTAGGDGEMMHVTVNLEGRPIADFVTRAMRRRQILVDAGAVT